MLTITTITELREVVASFRRSGQSIAFVPTMGNLHAGHLKLVNEAGKFADRVIVSIFVNPTQFGVGEDYESYPRTEAEDADKLCAGGTDILFLPTVQEMYGTAPKTTVSVQGLSTVYCGASRAGHFDGVATVVCKLFNLVMPDRAFFGEKDYQQLLVIRTLVRDLNFPIIIHGVATVRETDGLAMSSRNNYLTPAERKVAPNLYSALCRARDALAAGKRAPTDVEDEALVYLQQLGFRPEFFSVCRSDNLEPAAKSDKDLVILTAARLGRTRLIDNLLFSR